MTKSLWKAKSPSPVYPKLLKDIVVDVAIVGGGITGITAAYLLSKKGIKVAVLEALNIGGGTTADSTGNLYTMVDKRLHHIQSEFDDDTAKVVAESRTASVNFIEAIIKENNIECDFQRVPWYLYSETNKKDETIEKEKKAAEKVGLAVTMLQELPLPYKISSAIRIDNQAQFNPAAYVKGLAEKINGENCSIYGNTNVTNLENDDIWILSTPHGKVSAAKVIMATHTPKGVLGVQTAVYPYREYALAIKLNSGNYPEGTFWSTEANHHHSVRSYKTNTETYLIVVGEHHKVGQANNHQEYFSKLEAYARSKFDIASIAYRWSAQHYKPADGLPYIGEINDEGFYIATGFSTDGLTYGTMAAIIISDLITGEENLWAKTYDAKRFTPINSAKNFIKENVNVLGEYLKDYPGNVAVEDLTHIEPGEGQIIEMKDEKWAVYKSETGEIQAISAVCTHMECIVNWNNAEKTWDCPCHGSRFKPSGEVIEGPAYMPLEKKKFKEMKN